MRQQVKQLQQLREKVGDPAGSPNDQELLMNITEALTNLVTGTFIIEKQPPQVSYFCNFRNYFFLRKAHPSSYEYYFHG